MFRPTGFIVVAGLMVMATAQFAHACETRRMHVSSVRVDYSDLDLRDSADARAMLGRIERAAFQACGGDERLHPSCKLMPKRTTEVFRECCESAVSRAVAALNAQALWLAFRGRSTDRDGAPRNAKS